MMSASSNSTGRIFCAKPIDDTCITYDRPLTFTCLGCGQVKRIEIGDVQAHRKASFPLLDYPYKIERIDDEKNHGEAHFGCVFYCMLNGLSLCTEPKILISRVAIMTDKGPRAAVPENILSHVKYLGISLDYFYSMLNEKRASEGSILWVGDEPEDKSREFLTHLQGDPSLQEEYNFLQRLRKADVESLKTRGIDSLRDLIDQVKFRGIQGSESDRKTNSEEIFQKVIGFCHDKDVDNVNKEIIPILNMEYIDRWKDIFREEDAAILDLLIKEMVRHGRVDIVFAVLPEHRSTWLSFVGWGNRNRKKETIESLLTYRTFQVGSEAALLQVMRSDHCKLDLVWTKKDIPSDRWEMIICIAAKAGAKEKVEEFFKRTQPTDNIKKNVVLIAYENNQFELLEYLLISRGHFWRSSYLTRDDFIIVQGQLERKIDEKISSQQRTAFIRLFSPFHKDVREELFRQLHTDEEIVAFIERNDLEGISKDVIVRAVRQDLSLDSYQKVINSYLHKMEPTPRNCFVVDQCRKTNKEDRILLLLRHLSSLTYLPEVYQFSCDSQELYQAIATLLETSSFSKEEINQTMMRCLFSPKGLETVYDTLLQLIMSNTKVQKLTDFQIFSSINLLDRLIEVIIKIGDIDYLVKLFNETELSQEKTDSIVGGWKSFNRDDPTRYLKEQNQEGRRVFFEKFLHACQQKNQKYVEQNRRKALSTQSVYELSDESLYEILNGISEDLFAILIPQAICEGSDQTLAQFMRSDRFDTKFFDSQVISYQKIEGLIRDATQRDLVEKINKLLKYTRTKGIQIEPEGIKDVILQAWEGNRFRTVASFWPLEKGIVPGEYTRNLLNALEITEDKLLKKLEEISSNDSFSIDSVCSSYPNGEWVVFLYMAIWLGSESLRDRILLYMGVEAVSGCLREQDASVLSRALLLNLLLFFEKVTDRLIDSVKEEISRFYLANPRTAQIFPNLDKYLTLTQRVLSSFSM